MLMFCCSAFFQMDKLPFCGGFLLSNGHGCQQRYTDLRRRKNLKIIVIRNVMSGMVSQKNKTSYEFKPLLADALSVILL